MALANFLRLQTVSTGGFALQSADFKFYKNGVEIDKTGIVFKSPFDNSMTASNQVFEIEIAAGIDFDEYEFKMHSGLPQSIDSVTLLASTDNVNFVDLGTNNVVKDPAGSINRFAVGDGTAIPNQTPTTPTTPTTSAVINGVETDISSQIDEFNNFSFAATAGSTYTFEITNPNSDVSWSYVYDANTGNHVSDLTASDTTHGTWTATATGNYYIWLTNGGTLVSMIETAATPTQTVDTLIQDALDAVKTYVDTQDASVKAYADNLISQLMNTSDLTAKLELLNQINDILDGDAATAGFQAWQSSLSRLTSAEAAIVANKDEAAASLLASFATLKSKAVLTFAV